MRETDRMRYDRMGVHMAAKKAPAKKAGAKKMMGPTEGQVKRIATETTAKSNKPTKRLDATLTIRCSPAWREWVEAGARFLRTDVSKLTDVALIDYLKARGFDQPAPER